MSKYNKLFLLILIFSLTLFTLPVGAEGVAPDLATAGKYGILAETATVTEETSVTGSLGSGAITGTAVVSGSTDIANAAYITAFDDLGAAITNADLQEGVSTEIGSDLGGLTLTPGVYKSTGDVNIGSDLTLEGDGVYIFLINGAFTTAADTKIQLSGGAQACNIFWVSDVTTIGANSTLEGTVMSKSAITVGANSVTNGRILAQSEVTANAANTTINVPAACAALPTPEPEEEPTEVEVEPTEVEVEPIEVEVEPIEEEPTEEPAEEPTPTVPTITQPESTDDLCTSPAISVLSDSEGNMIIHAVLPNDVKATGTWNFDLGGKIYTVKGSEDITYTAENTPVGTYKVGAQFTSDDNGETVDLESCTVSVATVSGGQIPDTATPWYNLLFVGAVLSIIGIMGIMGTGVWNRRKIHA